MVFSRSSLFHQQDCCSLLFCCNQPVSQNDRVAIDDQTFEQFGASCVGFQVPIAFAYGIKHLESLCLKVDWVSHLNVLKVKMTLLWMVSSFLEIINIILLFKKSLNYNIYNSL